jgi:hypothetical protein
MKMSGFASQSSAQKSKCKNQPIKPSRAHIECSFKGKKQPKTGQKQPKNCQPKKAENSAYNLLKLLGFLNLNKV